MYNIKSITLLSENLFSMELHDEDIDEFQMKGLGVDVVQDTDGFKTIMTCSELIIRLKREANSLLEAPFCQEGTAFNLLDRDHCITRVNVTYDDDTTDTVYVPYEGDMYNEYMSTYITRSGDLLLLISPTKGVFDVFGQTVISLDQE